MAVWPPHLYLALALTLTLVLALVRNIIIFSKVWVLVLNQPINNDNNNNNSNNNDKDNNSNNNNFTPSQLPPFPPSHFEGPSLRGSW